MNGHRRAIDAVQRVRVRRRALVLGLLAIACYGAIIAWNVLRGSALQ